MKPWIAFLGGAVLAGGVALIGLRPSAPEAPDPATSIVAQQVSPVEPIGAEPEKPAPAEPSPAVTAALAPRAVPETPRRKPTPARQSSSSAASSSASTPASAPVVPTPAGTASSAPLPPAVVTPSPTPQEGTPAASEQPAVATREAEPSAPQPPPPPPNQVTIPAGSRVVVRLAQSVSAETAKNGDSFSATLDQPLVVDGFVLAERGARVSGKITASDPGGRVKGVSLLGLELTSFRTSDGQTVDIKTVEFRKEGESSTKSDATKVAVGAGVGAALGAIFGGGKGAAIGAGSGAAAGTGVVLATRGKPAVVPAETRLTFQMQTPVTVTEKR